MYLKDFLYGYIENFTEQYFSYRRITKKDDGTAIRDNDIIKGKGIYRKKGSQYYRLNLDGPVDIRWYGAVGDGITDNAKSINEAIAASPFIKIPSGDFAISSPVIINSTIQITGEGILQSKLTCLGKDMSAIVLGSNANILNLSMVKLSNLTINKGKYGVSAIRETGAKL